MAAISLEGGYALYSTRTAKTGAASSPPLWYMYMFSTNWYIRALPTPYLSPAKSVRSPLFMTCSRCLFQFNFVPKLIHNFFASLDS